MPDYFLLSKRNATLGQRILGVYVCAADSKKLSNFRSILMIILLLLAIKADSLLIEKFDWPLLPMAIFALAGLSIAFTKEKKQGCMIFFVMHVLNTAGCNSSRSY